MDYNVEAFKNLFGELSIKQRLEIASWMWKAHQEIMEFSSMGPAMQKVFAHFYPNASAALGLDGNTLTGNRPLSEGK